jgi:hypothetical protein
VKLGKMLEDKAHAYQALDSSAMPLLGMQSAVDMAGRRGLHIGWSNSIGWYLWVSLF